jgi:lipopolysaccharide transport system ATP-binding protein
MSSESLAIEVRNFSKCYQIYARPEDRLKQAVIPRIQRALGLGHSSYFREFWALRDVSFDVPVGQTLGIIGRNGSGKSTLLQMLCGTLTATSGNAVARGRIAALLELGAGFNPEFTGRENAIMNAALLGLSRAEVEDRIEDIIAFSEIGEFVDQPVKTYSSGMFVRLAFSVVAHVDADILIIDEALSVGDVFFVQKCFQFLRNFARTGTLLFVSHDTNAVMALCDRAIWLDSGAIKADGAPKAVADAYLEQVFASNRTETQAEPRASAPVTVECEPEHDMRQGLINGSGLRNDVEVFRFDPEAPSFSSDEASIVDVSLRDEAGRRLTWVVGGEIVELRIRCRVESHLEHPILGFYVRDRLGQTLFGDNTYLSYAQSDHSAPPGSMLEAAFEFRMPLLPPADYTICPALADGTQDEHRQIHWIHDALMLRSQGAAHVYGLVGLPMRHIRLTVSSTE